MTLHKHRHHAVSRNTCAPIFAVGTKTRLTMLQQNYRNRGNFAHLRLDFVVGWQQKGPQPAAQAHPHFALLSLLHLFVRVHSLVAAHIPSGPGPDINWQLCRMSNLPRPPRLQQPPMPPRLFETEPLSVSTI
eukprot:1955753-Rhodomonas_salina.1